jgi:hypothetical protein
MAHDEAALLLIASYLWSTQLTTLLVSAAYCLRTVVEHISDRAHSVEPILVRVTSATTDELWYAKQYCTVYGLSHEDAIETVEFGSRIGIQMDDTVNLLSYNVNHPEAGHT